MVAAGLWLLALEQAKTSWRAVSLMLLLLQMYQNDTMQQNYSEHLT